MNYPLRASRTGQSTMGRVIISALLFMMANSLTTAQSEQQPKTAKEYIKRGLALRRKGNLDRAIHDFTQANRDSGTSQTDLTGVWIHQRSTPRGAVKGTLELSRASSLDDDGYIAFLGVNTYKNKKDAPAKETPWLVAIKRERVLICIEGPCSIFGCAGSLTKNGEIVASCKLLTIDYAGEFRAKRLPKDKGPKPNPK